MVRVRRNFLVILLLFATLHVACNDENGTTPQPTQQTESEGTTPAAVGSEGGVSPESGSPEAGGAVQSTPEPTPIPASPTPAEPLAALVNGRPVLLSDYENELARLQQAAADLGAAGADYPQIALDTVVERELIAQAAAAVGVGVTEEEVNAQLADLQAEAGSAENFAAWLQTNQLTEEQFREALAVELLVQKMIERVVADVPFAAEQIHARYIRVDDPVLVQSLLDQINSGADFAELARQNSLDPSAAGGGDMGFFMAGTLFVPELEAPAFALQPGQTSDVIPVTHSDGTQTYYILQVIERVAQRPLEGNQRDILIEQTILSWIEGLRTQAEITIFVDTNAE